jgi:aldose 1-epimerase
VRQSEPIEQLSLSRVTENGTSIAVISPQGGAISQLLVNDFEIVPQFSLSDPLAFIYGHVLAPWPNRLEDGRYGFREKSFGFDNLDSDRNVNHGFLLTELLELRSHQQDRLVLGYRFGKNPGYPFSVDLEIEYRLVDSGLEVSASAKNLGEDAPFAIGFHPYLLTGAEFELTADFKSQSVNDARMLPIGENEISSLELNQDSNQLRSLDHCFSGADKVLLTRPAGKVLVEALENLPFFMLYRPSQLLADAGPVIAIEPQSAKANVFRNDIESVLLASGETRKYRFAIRKL